jgi:hypothetical protein
VLNIRRICRARGDSSAPISHDPVHLTTFCAIGGQLPFAGDSVPTAAMLDRVLHHSIVVSINGESFGQT